MYLRKTDSFPHPLSDRLQSELASLCVAVPVETSSNTSDIWTNLATHHFLHASPQTGSSCLLPFVLQLIQQPSGATIREKKHQTSQRQVKPEEEERLEMRWLLVASAPPDVAFIITHTQQRLGFLLLEPEVFEMQLNH